MDDALPASAQNVHDALAAASVAAAAGVRQLPVAARTAAEAAQALGCEAYFGKQTTGHRTESLARFRETPSAVIVATSALGMGVDIPDIRCIIHIGRPRSLLEYAQESGRARRDGEASEAIMIWPAAIEQAPGYVSESSAKDYK